MTIPNPPRSAPQVRWLHNDLVLRPVSRQDEGFLRYLYQDTRRAELAQLNLSVEALTLLVDSHFATYRQFYKTHYPTAALDLVVYKSSAVGYVHVNYTAEEIRILDIALLTTYRGVGLGSQLLSAITQESEGLRVPVRVQIERNHPMIAWYLRWNFQCVGNGDAYLLMERWPRTQLDAKADVKPNDDVII